MSYDVIMGNMEGLVTLSCNFVAERQNLVSFDVYFSKNYLFSKFNGFYDVIMTS